MSMHDHEDYDRDDDARPAPRPRRDPLGLWALLGPDSDLVPISDYDGALGCSGGSDPCAPGAAGTQGPVANGTSAMHPSTCGSCTSHCPSALPALERFQRSQTTEEPS
jgi:hypothetical protein